MRKKQRWQEPVESTEIAEAGVARGYGSAPDSSIVVCTLCDATTSPGITYYSALITPETAGTMLERDIAEFVPLREVLDGRFELVLCWPCAAEIRPEDLGVLIARQA